MEKNWIPQLEALNKAIVEAVLYIELDGATITFNSLNELITMRNMTLLRVDIQLLKGAQNANHQIIFQQGQALIDQARLLKECKTNLKRYSKVYRGDDALSRVMNKLNKLTLTI